MNPICRLALLSLGLCACGWNLFAGGLVDSITFGDATSESGHQFAHNNSERIVGGLGEPARRLLPAAETNWQGGRMSFTLAVDAEKPNYATIRLWGSDATPGMLILFCEGKQIGYRHLGDIDLLDIAGNEPLVLGRFAYNTTPLPLELTRGKTNLHFEIRSTGPVWAYGQRFDIYQKPMTEPSRGLYKFYTHTDGAFVPPSDEKQGVAPKDAPIAARPGPEVLDQVKERVNKELDARLNSPSPCSQMQLQLLARAYDIKWTKAYHNPKTIEQIVRGLDGLFHAYRANPGLAQAEPSTWNPDWFGLGVCGEVIALRQQELQSFFAQEIDDSRGGTITRRVAFTEMLLATREWHRRNRRLYTNQSMLKDLNGIYNANRGIAVLAPEQAFPEPQARRYLYESVGLEPWRGNDPSDDRPESDRNLQSIGTNYLQFTAKGLTRELGYVGGYGEVMDLVCDIYNATRPAHAQPGDERIKAQLLKLAHARINFRHPSLNKNGERIMRLEQAVGWRDHHFPGYLAYGQRATRDASAVQTAALTLDPQLVGVAQQMFAENQFFASEVVAMNDRAQPLRTTIGRLETPDQYELLQAQPPQTKRLPMTPGQPDFVFSDEQNGVVAIKHGDEILYASLYWRARYAVNFLARVHYITPTMERMAVVRAEAEYTPSGDYYPRPNWINFGFGNGGPRYPEALESAHAGERLPIAKPPAGISFRPGSENIYAGKADFYTLRYEDYLIGMNLTTDRTFTLKTPEAAREAKELVTGKTLELREAVRVRPRTTVVLYFGKP
jgi:hypothetical protein